MSKPRISDADLCRAAKRLKTKVAEVKTFLAVETKNRGFDEYDRPVILFERHWFHRFTKGKYDQSHPNISNAVAGGYGKSATQYDRFSVAFGLDPNAAMKSASWGLGQVMGFNYAIAGYANVGEFVDAMKESEGKQLDASVEFILHNGLDDELRQHQWRGFARGYNGSGYEKNDYHNKLSHFYQQFSSAPQPDCSKVSAATPTAGREDQAGTGSVSIGDPAPLSAGGGSDTVEQPPTDVTASLVPVKTPVIEVEQVKPEAESKIDKTIAKWSARFVAVPAAALSFLAGLWSWVKDSPTNLTITLIITGSAVAVVYFGIRMIITSRDKARADKLQADREQRAHELQILTLKSAMEKNLNTVRIVPTPIDNSDAPGEPAAVLE
jgi:hypothetical protein